MVPTLPNSASTTGIPIKEKWVNVAAYRSIRPYPPFPVTIHRSCPIPREKTITKNPAAIATPQSRSASGVNSTELRTEWNISIGRVIRITKFVSCPAKVSLTMPRFLAKKPTMVISSSSSASVTAIMAYLLSAIRQSHSFPQKPHSANAISARNLQLYRIYTFFTYRELQRCSIPWYFRSNSIRSPTL